MTKKEKKKKKEFSVLEWVFVFLLICMSNNRPSSIALISLLAHHSAPCIDHKPCTNIVMRINIPLRWIFSECDNYQSLTTSDRKISNTRGCYTCDSSLSGWYRFKDAAGTRMPTTCPPTNRCDACSTGWLNGVHPTTADGKVTRQVCFNWSSNCCFWNINIEVRNCGSYFVYNLPPTPACTLRYCSTD